MSMLSISPPATSSRRSSRWPLRIGICATLLLAAAIWDGSTHRPLGPAAGQGFHGTFAAESGSTDATLRVASFNIHGCRNEDGHFDFDRTAAALAGFDLIGLNEVHGAWSWQQADQAELLGRRLEHNWLFAPTTFRWWRDDFGNGLLARLEVKHWERFPLQGTRNKGHRNRIVAQVRHGQTTIHWMVTHVDRVQDRAAQFKEVAAAFLALPEPALLMGDLNTNADDSELANLLGAPGVHDLVADGMSPPAPRRIDWILGRGLRAIDGGVIDTGASDHPLVWAEISLESRD